MISEKTLKDIKNLICLRSSLNSALPAVADNNITLTNPYKSANGFNKYFINISSNTQFSIKFSWISKKKSWIPSYYRHKFFFIKAVDKSEISFFYLSIREKLSILMICRQKSWNYLAMIYKTTWLSYLIFSLVLEFFHQNGFQIYIF